MQTTLLGKAILLGGILFSATICMAGENKGAPTMVLTGGSMGAVAFTHGQHQTMFTDCKPCHDLFPKKAQSVDTLKAEGKLQKKEVMNMCKDCHKSLGDKKQKTGPTNCTGCHKR